MTVVYSGIFYLKNQLTILSAVIILFPVIRPSCTREERNKRKTRDRRVLLPSHGVVDFTSHPRQHGVAFAVQVY